MTHVPYKGSAPILSDLISGRVSMVFDPILVPMAYVKEGKLKVAGFAADERFPTEPDIPTLKEQKVEGLEDFSMGSWGGILAPKGTPKEIIEKMSSELIEVAKDPDVIEKFVNAGFIPVGSTPEEFQEKITENIKLYKEIVDKNDIKAY